MLGCPSFEVHRQPPKRCLLLGKKGPLCEHPVCSSAASTAQHRTTRDCSSANPPSSARAYSVQPVPGIPFCVTGCASCLAEVRSLQSFLHLAVQVTVKHGQKCTILVLVVVMHPRTKIGTIGTHSLCVTGLTADSKCTKTTSAATMHFWRCLAPSNRTCARTCCGGKRMRHP